MGIENLNGSVTDHDGNPIANAKVSVYRKIGEIFTDINGDYSDINYADTNEFLVSSSKDEYFSENKDFSEERSDFILMKNDAAEPPLPSNIQVTDYQTGDSILISWSDVLFDFVAGYNIYRSDSEKGVFERINDEIILDNNYIDTELESLKEYFYMLEVVSANNPVSKGATSYSTIIGPIVVTPLSSFNDITNSVERVKVDSTKTNREAEKIFDNNDSTWWESQSGAGSWVELVFDGLKNFSAFYFKKPSKNGILFATLQYWNYTLNNWSNIQNLDYFVDTEYRFENFIVNSDRIRLYINNVEPLSESQISKIIVYGQ